MKYLSLFSGIGGFELGIQQAYEDKISNSAQVPKQESLSEGGDNLLLTCERDRENRNEYPTCIGYSEIDKYAIQVYEKHFKHKNYGDCTKIITSELPDFDLLVGGFPCQAFSIAGKRRGFDEARGTLFFDIARILADKKPRNFILENVKGLLSHDSGRTFTTIIRILSTMGYFVEWQVLNAKNFGVPQNRERVFIVGHLGGQPRRKVFPITGESTKVIKRFQGDVSGKGYASQEDRVYHPDGVMATLPHAHPDNKLNIFDYAEETNTNKALQILWNKIGKEAFYEWAIGRLGSFQKEKVLQSGVYGGEIQGDADKEKSTMDDGTLSRQTVEAERELRNLWDIECQRCSPQRPRLEEQFARELTENMQKLPYENTSFRIRRLTPLEAERLMGYPDDWTLEGTQGKISDTQRYKMCGNGIVSNVVKEVVKKLYH